MISQTAIPQLENVIEARGPLSEAALTVLTATPKSTPVELVNLEPAAIVALEHTDDIAEDEDIQLALFLLQSIHYGGVFEHGDEWEWNPQIIAVRTRLEHAFEDHLRAIVDCPPSPPAEREKVASLLFQMTSPDSGPSLSRFAAKSATEAQLRELLIQRSVYTLKEADPHSWAIPRLNGRSKAALIEIQNDEYGQGRPEQMHATVFADTLRSIGLDARYGAYLNQVPGITLASFTMMTMFGLNARLRGAIVGHLAAFEMTSSIPSRMYGNGFRRLGYGAETTRYFDIHVEADAIHEQIAGRDLAGSLAEDEPRLIDDIVFGAAACLTIDGLVGAHIMAAWQSGHSSLRATGATNGVEEGHHDRLTE